MVEFVETGQLRIGYEDRGPADGRPVLLLHGWPDDARAWDAAGASLAAAGWRTISPYLRGFGPTAFRDPATPRTAEPTAMAQDAIDLLDALGIERVAVAGHDWGARIGYALAALWPHRLDRLVALSVIYQTGVPSGADLDYRQQRAYWYQWFLGSERGREALLGDREEFCRFLWRTWCPSWRFTDEAFAAAAKSWAGADWVDVTLHSYRVRWGGAAPDPQWKDWEARLAAHPPISVPTVFLHGEEDGAVLVEATPDQSASFTGPYRAERLPGVGHMIPRERPEAVVDALTSPD